ncbi:MAG: rRNA maturation RNase YbeY [Malacoplasma sp.]|nr:rRNA maturation RNase YbeY [Malacoplasma sp.]
MFQLKINDSKKILSTKEIKLIKKIANLIFKAEKLEGKIIFELHIINNYKSKKINAKFRNKDYATDVISFSLWENSEIRSSLLGEIFLNYDKVLSQAKKHKHSILRELAFLVSHGIYHLLCYDHIAPDDAKIMFAKQYQILKLVGLGSINDIVND